MEMGRIELEVKERRLKAEEAREARRLEAEENARILEAEKKKEKEKTRM